MADSSRNILLAVLVVGVAVAAFYMMDPTLGGLLTKREGFQDTMAPSTNMDDMAPSMKNQDHMGQMHMAPSMTPESILPPNNPPSVSGMQMEKFENPQKEMEMVAKKLEDAMKGLQRKEKYQDFKKKETFQGEPRVVPVS
jgi:hypothetical protein